MLAEPNHLAVASGCLILIPEEMEHAVGRQESNLLPDGSFSAPGLLFRLLRADQDLAEVETPAVLRPAPVDVRYGRSAAVTGRDRLAKGEDVGGPVAPPKALVQGAHLGVGYERDLHLGIRRQSIRSDSAADRLTDRSDLARRLAGDGDAHAASRSRRA